MALFQTDAFGVGAGASPRTGGVYAENVAFSTANSPGTSFAISQKFAQSDTIGLFYLPTPGRLYRYSIDVPILDGNGGGAVVMVLEDGLGNTYQSGIAHGQSGAGNPNRLTDVTALANTIGQIDYTSQAVAFLRLRVTTTATNPISAAANIRGMAVMQKN